MSLSNLRDGKLKELFDAMEAAFRAVETDYYIIGALARDVWFIRGEKSFRATKDVDFAVLVGSQQDYQAVRNYLAAHYQFRDSKENAFVMISPSGFQVDLLPFGEIAIDDSVEVTGEGLTSIRVNGFEEVYRAGTKDVELETGHHFEVATLASIVLLKVIAFDDRPEKRFKDPRDIATIIEHYFELQADQIYANHTDEFLDENDPRTLQEISATVIGKEIKQMCLTNPALLERLIKILEAHISGADDSSFIRQMIRETDRPVEENVRLLEYMLSGIR
jgi:predicted nucleotidyltransferase